MAFNLLLSDDLKELTKGSFSAEFDPLLDNTLIPAVTASFAHYCNRPDFDLKVRTEYFSPKIHQDSIIVSSPPVAPLLTSLRTAALKWLLSVAGAGIYYVQLVGNGSASLADPTSVLENGVEMNRKLTAALSAGEFYYGDADNLGFNTVYVNLSDSSDPDSKALDYVQHSKLTARLWEDYSRASYLSDRTRQRNRFFYRRIRWNYQQAVLLFSLWPQNHQIPILRRIFD